MELGFGFFFNSVLLGVGLAMDAFSVSLANGLNEPCMRKRRMCVIAGVFAFFQALMPMLGWVCVHTIAQYFQAFEKLIPDLPFSTMLIKAAETPMASEAWASVIDAFRRNSRNLVPTK